MPANDTVLSVFGVNPVRIGGTEDFARELSRQLDAVGWRSVLCFLGEPKGAVREYLSGPNIQLECIPGRGFAGWRQGLAVLALLRRHRPSVVHLHYLGFVGPYPWLARAAGTLRVFFTDHTSRAEAFVPSRAPWWKRAAVRMVNRPLTRVVSVSEFGRQCLAQADLLPADRLQMVYDGVDGNRARVPAAAGRTFRRSHGIPLDRVLVTQVSWMIPEKGIEDLLRAAQLVLRHRGDVHFALVGEGPLRAKYEVLAKELGISDRVVWTGRVADPFQAGVYAATDIACQMSRWEEVFGWVIAEAMASGKPVVATRVGGIPEVVADGLTGVLVNRRDIHAMAREIEHLASSPEVRAAKGEAGRRRVLERFDLAANVERLVRAYGISAEGLSAPIETAVVRSGS